MFTTLRRLQERDAEWRVDERFNHYQNALTDIVEKASREAVEYARQFENPVSFSKTCCTSANISTMGRT